MLQEHLRNVAIIAHVDHGKTTLVDRLLAATGAYRENQQVTERVLDSNDQERERGITILAKNISITYEDVKINVIDTPGHADFGGEVERVLKMADSALLLVDAYEGPMPQTRFVLRHAIDAGLRVLLVVNKIDRDGADPDRAVNDSLDLMMELGATDEQLEFALEHVVYTSASQGYARLDPADGNDDMFPLLDAIVDWLPAPDCDPEGPLALQVMTVDHSSYVGRIGIGRVFSGTIRSGERVLVVKNDEYPELAASGATGAADSAASLDAPTAAGSDASADHGMEGAIQLEPALPSDPRIAQVKQLYTFDYLGRRETDEIGAGDICAVVGIDGVDIGDVLSAPERPLALPPIRIDPPTMAVVFEASTSPLVGREGTIVGGRQLRDRLMREAENNVTMEITEVGAEAQAASGAVGGIEVKGRGILHLSVLMETLRREGFEFQVARPRVLFVTGEHGETLEPVEQAVVECPDEASGRIIEIFGEAGGMLTSMESNGTTCHLEFSIPTRGILGLKNRILNASHGEGVFYHTFLEYGPYAGEMTKRTNGAMISMATEKAVAYALGTLQERGQLFVGPGDDCYEGMIVGERSRAGDMEVNVARTKNLGNQRSSTADIAVQLTPPRTFTLEEALEYIADDELVEITPQSIRLRKRILDTHERKKDNVRRGRVAKLA